MLSHTSNQKTRYFKRGIFQTYYQSLSFKNHKNHIIKQQQQNKVTRDAKETFLVTGRPLLFCVAVIARQNLARLSCSIPPPANGFVIYVRVPREPTGH